MHVPGKYQPFPRIHHPNRQWPAARLEKPPRWCSVDLRDGNQALMNPMDTARKAKMFDLLVRRGFKEIEVGFPSASASDFNFIRHLIEAGKIPEDVTIQVATQSRSHLINRTFEAVEGAPRVNLHLYNSTSPAQRQFVFQKGREGIIAIACSGAELISEQAAMRSDTCWTFQYSPESFSQTELDFSVQICLEVYNIWQHAHPSEVIMNLPDSTRSVFPQNR